MFTNYPDGAQVLIRPDPANPGAILTTVQDATPRSFVLSLEECGKLARALAEYVPAEEPGVRPCPVCEHDPRDDNEIERLRDGWRTDMRRIRRAYDAAEDRLGPSAHGMALDEAIRKIAAGDQS